MEAAVLFLTLEEVMGLAKKESIEIKRAAGDLSKLAAELNSMAGWFKV